MKSQGSASLKGELPQSSRPRHTTCLNDASGTRPSVGLTASLTGRCAGTFEMLRLLVLRLCEGLTLSAKNGCHQVSLPRHNHLSWYLVSCFRGSASPQTVTFDNMRQLRTEFQSVPKERLPFSQSHSSPTLRYRLRQAEPPRRLAVWLCLPVCRHSLQISSDLRRSRSTASLYAKPEGTLLENGLALQCNWLGGENRREESNYQPLA